LNGDAGHAANITESTDDDRNSSKTIFYWGKAKEMVGGAEGAYPFQTSAGERPARALFLPARILDGGRRL